MTSLQSLAIIYLCLYACILNAQIQGPSVPDKKQFREVNLSPTLPSNKNRPISNNLNYTSTQNTSKERSYDARTPFTISYKIHRNISTIHQATELLSYYSETHAFKKDKKELWELKLHNFSFVNPTTELYNAFQPYYDAAYDSIQQMLTGHRPLDLKKAVFLSENAFYRNKLSYSEFCKLIAEKVHILHQILKEEKLDTNNNVALNYAIQQLYMRTVTYKNSKGITKVHLPLKYDFEDHMGQQNFSKQLVSKLLHTGKGQCHSLPLLYLILAQEIGAESNMVYSPEHSFIAFPDKEMNYYNFECTSACFTSYSYVMSSGYVNMEAIKSGIYMTPVSLKESVANVLKDLAYQQYIQFGGVSEFQLKCCRKTLETYPNDIMAWMMVANYQSAKTEAEICRAGWPDLKDIPKNPDLKQEFDIRNQLYDYIDNLGYTVMPIEEYKAWLELLRREKEKQESEQIKKALLIKGNIQD